jgi:ribonuclease PH
VLQGDGGTRTASITGSFIALADALHQMMKQGLLRDIPIRDFVAATSVGLVNGEALLDLCYEEDAKAEVDMNVIMTGSGEFIEIQGCAERKPFNKTQMDKLLALAKEGIAELIDLQRGILKNVL